MRLSKKRIIVTGAATGIGRATAELVAAQGAKVAIFDTNDQDGQAIASQISTTGGTAHYWHADVRNSQEVSNVTRAAVKWLGGTVDVLLHLAGILKGAAVSLPTFSDEVWNEVLDVNLKGSYLVCKHVARYMIDSGSGVIILCSSQAGVSGSSSSFAYGSSKGAIHGLSMILSQRLEEHGIRVHDVCPAAVETPLKIAQLQEMKRHSGSETEYQEALRQLVPPHGIASIFAFLSSDEARYVRGSVFTC